MATKKLTALIDGDIYIFKAAAASEHAVEWTEDLWTLHAHMTEAIQLFENKLEQIKEETGASDLIVALSDTVNFRYGIYPDYKHNRKDKRPPLLRAPLKEYVQAKYPCFLRPGLEGDDVLGILATSQVIVKGTDKIIVSEDKDMKTIPCKLYNTGKQTCAEITEREADYWHLLQTLTGDTADGYPGCPGVGPVRAEKLLVGMLEGEETLSHWWGVVVAAYTKAGLCEEQVLIQARVARICRKTDYNFKKKEVILWTPPPAPQ